MHVNAALARKGRAMEEYCECKGVRKLEILYLVVDSHYHTFGM
jgi:hypothetical protein